MSYPEDSWLLPSHPFQISYGASDDRLHDFYIPALERAVRFDRTTGFFSSTSLALAASGLCRLIAGGGRMRLLCGAQLSAEDVEAIRKGAALKAMVGAAMARDLSMPKEMDKVGRIEALAWMVANETLDIRVVLPKGADGNPLPASEAREYYHPKEGLFEDSDGNRLAFTGSVNDSENGWQLNYEVLTVYCSWERRLGSDLIQPMMPYITQVRNRFERLWEGREPQWIAMDIPAAARDRLLSFRPAQAPSRDPRERGRPGRSMGEKAEPWEVGPSPEERERMRRVFDFVKAAPTLPNAVDLAMATSTVQPWPHQRYIVRRAVATYPQSYLFCDEVGLGKTIEAGLVLRQLWISRRIRRALLLVPKSILKQWQEELYEKFALNVPRLDGDVLLDYSGRELPMPDEGPWEGCDLLLASLQLARHRNRRDDILKSEKVWDLVLLDEAHHARRKGFLQLEEFRPNRLLELLIGTHESPGGLKTRTRCLYMMTATPMQVHPLEVFDLLSVLGVGGRWESSQKDFLDFYEVLRGTKAAKDWTFLLEMFRDANPDESALDPHFVSLNRKQLGEFQWQHLCDIAFGRTELCDVGQLDPMHEAVLSEMIRRHTPIQRFSFRNTRSLLRRYRAEGLLKENIPVRKPKNIWIRLDQGTDGHMELYRRIEDYIVHFYNRFEETRRGTGFIMTIYRRRLTSSFHAIQLSLEKRLDALEAQQYRLDSMLSEEDQEILELDGDIDASEYDDVAEVLEASRDLRNEEIRYLREFIDDLRQLPCDPKKESLLSDLLELFKHRDKVILFTQYTDTLDDLRDTLKGIYGGAVACYSGRGGEVWNGESWVLCKKEDLKKRFTEGEYIRLLLCTESASEGLNLQTCGILINYDMPWNPMQVEQRIGRIDRIGQVYPEVWIHNYFYEDTVEAQVYHSLEDRIAWFQEVVGNLQPILQEVDRVIQEGAMTSFERRQEQLDQAVANLRKQIDEVSANAFNLDRATAGSILPLDEARDPLSQTDLEEVLTGARIPGLRFRKNDALAGAYQMQWDGKELLVTFDPQVFDKRAQTVRYLTYGEPVLDRLLAAGGEATSSTNPAGVARLEVDGAKRTVQYWSLQDDQTLSEIGNLSSLRAALEAPSLSWDERACEAANTRLATMKEEAEREAQREQQLRSDSMRAFRRKAAILFKDMAACYLALQIRDQSLFVQWQEDSAWKASDILSVLVQQGQPPFPGLQTLATDSEIGLVVEATDLNRYLEESRREVLVGTFQARKEQGLSLLRRVKAFRERGPTDEEAEVTGSIVWWGEGPVQSADTLSERVE